MDKLDVIFNKQKEFDDKIVLERNLQNISMDKWIQMETLALMSELSELIDEVNFKWWKNPKEINVDNVKSELIDVLHFFVSMCIKTGMTSKEVYERYLDKNTENFKRQDGTSDKIGYSLNEKNN